MTKDIRRFPLSAPASLAAGLALLFIYLMYRNLGMYPTIFADETIYSTYARLTPLSEATVPSYLYLWLFRSTNSCVDGFMDCARLFNSVLFLGSAPFMYLIARRLMRPPLACLSALISVAGPVNLYTLYFMPEATYFLGFWILTWTVLRLHEAPTAVRALTAGVVLGLLVLVKMHGLFIIPALCLFLAWSAFSRRSTPGRWLLDAIRTVGLVLVAAAAVRFSIGYLLAGVNGLSLTGPLYSAQAGNSPITGQSLTQLIQTTLGVLRGHLMGLAVLFAVPLCGLAVFGLSRSSRDAAGPELRAFAVYMVLVIATLVGVTVMFTVSVSGTGFDTDQRLHMRYYDFALPLLTIFIAAQAERAATPKRSIVLSIAIVMAALLIYTAWRLTLDYTPLISDSASLHGLSMFPKFFPFFCLVVIATVLVWAFDTRRGVYLCLWALMPLLALGGGIALSRQLHWASYADPYSNAALFARDYLDPAPLDRLTVVGASIPGLYKAKLYLSSPGVQIHHVDDTEKFDLAGYPDQKHWLLIVGKFTPPADYAGQMVQARGYVLIKPPRPGTPGIERVDFSQDLRDEGLVRVSGLSAAESFGRWSDAKVVELELPKALPRKLGLELKLYAYGPNAGQQVSVTVGKQERLFAAPAQLATMRLDFDTDGTEQTIRITIPQPTSPKQSGTGADERTLGLAFHELILRDKEHPANATP